MHDQIIKVQVCKLPGSYLQCMYTYFLPGVIGVLSNGEERSNVLAYEASEGQGNIYTVAVG
jgi:hypothetical protein